jgi:MFS family permease
MTKTVENKLRDNVKKNYLYSFMSNFNLTQGVWMLYLAYRGLSLFEIGMMESIFHITSFTMEVPTGMIADLYGRKTSRILGRLLAVVSTVIMLLSTNLVFFMMSFIFSALSYNLESGAGDALIYDSLKSIGEENDYMKITGRREIFYQLASTGALLIGGYLATIDYLLVYQFALAIGVLTVVQTFSFTEPEYGKIEHEENGFKTMAKQLKRSMGVLAADKKIGFLIVVVEVFSLYFTTEFFYMQNLMKLAGRTEFEIGATLAIGSLGGALMASRVHKFDEKYSPDQLLRAFPILGIIGFWLMAIPGITWFAFVFLSLVEGAMFVSISDYINRLIPSEQRATILSFQSMLFSILMIVLFPLVGKIGDLIGLGRAFFIIAIFATVTLGVLQYIVTTRASTFKSL